MASRVKFTRHGDGGHDMPGRSAARHEEVQLPHRRYPWASSGATERSLMLSSSPNMTMVVTSELPP